MKFKVGAINYEVTEVHNLFHKHELFGQVTFDDGMIEIDSSLCEQRKHNVIIHELLHACLFEAGYDEQDEEQVRRLGNVLTQVLRDNDFGFLRGQEDEEKCPHKKLLMSVDGKGRVYCAECNETIQEGLQDE